jgi:hypothetical protein
VLDQPATNTEIKSKIIKLPDTHVRAWVDTNLSLAQHHEALFEKLPWKVGPNDMLDASNYFVASSCLDGCYDTCDFFPLFLSFTSDGATTQHLPQKASHSHITLSPPHTHTLMHQ